MTNMRIRWRGLGFVVAAVALTATTMTPTYAAKGSPGPPHPPTEEGEVAPNNLSVPTLFVPDTTISPFTGTCTTGDDSQDPVPPMGVDLDGDLTYDDHLDYYVQGVTTWQADCATASVDTLTVGAEWGDNLTSAPLKARTPIRVEIGFLADPAAFPMMPGYEVVKLDPSLLDRESHYGTLGNEVVAFPEVRVWNSGVTLDIRSKDGTVIVANNVLYTAEVNSTGRVVYGFNWQKPLSGEYTLTVTTSGITLGSTDAGILYDSDGDGVLDAVKLDLTVGNKGGGGGGSGGRPADRPRN